MFKQMGINKIVESINNKMINGELVIKENELIALIKEYTDNKFNINLGTNHGNNIIMEYGNVALLLRKK